MNPISSALRDWRLIRSGFAWGKPRPRSWPQAAPAVPDRPSNLGWARMEPVRSIRFLLQTGLLMPFTKVMTDPQVHGSEWVRDLDRPAIIASNHVSHADTPLLLHALSDRTRERTAVAAAADYFYKRPWLGRVVSLWLNTFPFARTGGAPEDPRQRTAGVPDVVRHVTSASSSGGVRRCVTDGQRPTVCSAISKASSSVDAHLKPSR